MNADGSGKHQLTNTSTVNEGSPVWSPDGTTIAFTSDRDGNEEIYVTDVTGLHPVRLTNNVASDRKPDWSPDGSKIVFFSNRDGNEEIYVMNADGSNPVRLTYTLTAEEDPVWSPDGQKIVFTRNRGGNWDIFTMNADGSNETQLTFHAAYDGQPSWQPIPTTRKSVTVDEAGFTPQTLTVPLGARVGWNFTGTVEHSVADASGVGLFGSGDMPPGGAYAATFFAAGTYTTVDLWAVQFGTIRVPIRVTPPIGPPGTTFTVWWASMADQASVFFDMQIQPPGSIVWRDYLRRVAAESIQIAPTVAGTYRFRARLRGHGNHSGWSPTRTLIVQ
jgi:plastocyanin